MGDTAALEQSSCLHCVSTVTSCLGQLLAVLGTALKLCVATCRQQEVLAAAQAEGSVQGVNSSLAADLVQATVQQAQTMRQVPP